MEQETGIDASTRERKPDDGVPFVPALALGVLVSLFIGAIYWWGINHFWAPEGPLPDPASGHDNSRSALAYVWHLGWQTGMVPFLAWLPYAVGCVVAGVETGGGYRHGLIFGACLFTAWILLT